MIINKTLLILLWLLLAFMTYSTVEVEFDDIVSDAMERLEEAGKILVPIPKDVLAEGLFYFGSYIIPLDSETELCRNHSALLFNAFINNEMWAIKMVDASSKFGAGILDGRVMDLGNYDMCVGLEAPKGLFTGQHCVVETKGILSEKMDNFNAERQVTPVLRSDVMISVCVPSSCTAQDVRTHMDVILNSINASAIMYNTSCSSATPLPLEKTDIFAIFVLLSIVCLIFTSTVYEYSVDKKSENQLLSSFSLGRNIRQLFAPELNHNCLHCLHGLRVICFVWLIVGHRMLHITSIPMTRLMDIRENYDSLVWAPILESPMSVEIFFLMSGLLAAYNYLKDRLKGNKFSYVSFLFNRYKRLTPSLATMLLLNGTLFIHLSDGPIWNRIFSFNKERCQANWWSNLLYINNFYGVFNMCMIQSWYLAADFQMHMVCPLILFILHKHNYKGLAVVSIASVASIAASTVHSIIWELPAEGPLSINRKRHEEFVDGYCQPQYRVSTFLMGIFLGYFIFKVKQEQLIVKPPKVVLILTWLLSALLIVGSVFGITLFVRPGHIFHPWIDPVYWVLHRHTLVLGVAWIIFVCTIGFGGVVNQILSWNAFVPLSRLSYAVYLVHFFIQDVESLSTRTTVNVRLLSPWYFACADTLISVVAAAVLYLTVEAPFVNIFKYKKSK